ncbi:MAG: bifunctional nuclease family protein [Spirochaetes bacterium]|nr:bifunctional nuclease family protein [Spirochaetota bacterium]
MESQIEMTVMGIYMDPKSNLPIVILRDSEGKKVLPIWIGPLEASSILLGLEKVTPPRPLTHDLLINFLKENNIKIVKIEINDLKDNTYFAKIYYKTKFRIKNIDARPSDAISLAIRTKSPVFVNNKVILNTFAPVNFAKGEMDEDFYKDYLTRMNKKDFGENVM